MSRVPKNVYVYMSCGPREDPTDRSAAWFTNTHMSRSDAERERRRLKKAGCPVGPVVPVPAPVKS